MNINKELAGMNVSSARGAPMGRRTIKDNPAAKVYVQQVQFVDGDYDAGGAYWGGYPAKPLYCAMSKEGDFMAFVRAESRPFAIAQFAIDYPELTFWMNGR